MMTRRDDSRWNNLSTRNTRSRRSTPAVIACMVIYMRVCVYIYVYIHKYMYKYVYVCGV